MNRLLVFLSFLVFSSSNYGQVIVVNTTLDLPVDTCDDPVTCTGNGNHISGDVPDLPGRDGKITFREALIAANPADETLRFGLGTLYLKEGRFEEASAPLEEAIRLKRCFTAAYLALGKAHLKNKNAAKAKEAFEEGIRVAEQTGDEMTGKAMRSLLATLASS